MGKKYTIELKDNQTLYTAEKDEDGVLCFFPAILSMYKEPDLEQVRKEAYEDGYKTAKVQCNIQAEKDMREVGERHYQKGLSDAWEAARKLVLDSNHGGLTNYDIEEIFGVDEEQAIINYSASEAVEKIRQYEQEQEQIQVGDEVKTFERKPFIVTGFGYGDDAVYCHGFVTENGISTSAKKDECVKTGRYFPEIAEVMQKAKR